MLFAASYCQTRIKFILLFLYKIGQHDVGFGSIDVGFDLVLTGGNPPGLDSLVVRSNILGEPNVGIGSRKLRLVGLSQSVCAFRLAHFCV